jgi:hypothetical protein
MTKSHNYAETTDAAPLLEQMAKHADAGLPFLAIEFDPATYEVETPVGLTDQLCDRCLAVFEDLLADETLEGPASWAFVDRLLDLLCERCRAKAEQYL